MALAAYRIYQDMHINKPLSFVGVDGLAGPDGGMENVSNGVLKATALYPTGGDKAIQVATDILRSRSFEKENLLKTTIIDSTNVFVMQMQGEKILSQQRDILRQESKNQEQIKIYYSQRTLIYILLTGLVMLIVVSTIAIFSWREKIEINKRLEANSKEISNQRDTIAEIARQAEVATNEKLKFFTNISHEFKTPLTLIMGPVELLLAKGAEIQNQSRESALLIQKNALRLLRLVNQLMDFRKIEDKKMVMHVAEIDLIPFIQDIVAAFDDMAKKRKILFEFKSDIKKLPAFFDPDMLDKVIFNLLSNAFKFTKDKGIIRMSVSLDSKAKNTFIFIEDNGEGMSPESVQHAFDRFYTGEHLGGTGLGLSLSKEFMDLHHGNLSLTSEKGKGTRFCIMVPLGMDHFEPNQILSSIPDYSRSQSYDPIIQDQVERYQSSTEHEGSHEHSVLIIEDNKELRTFLKGQLNRFYDVQEASDGPEGIRIAFEGVPDIIITDVKLPGKDGFEVSRILKQDLRTSHIPIIILTAKGTAEQKIVGIQTGADDYITKPFVFEFLVEKIKALIKTREALREHYSQDLKIGQPVFASRGLDKKFINDFRALVEKNIANPDFNVNDFGPELGMSRIQIYRKVKALIGYSVNDYVIDARLKKAQYLLLHTNRTIAEISSEVGFSSPNYFSTTFKSKFNLSPKEYKVAHFSAN
jgi:signal transduction histidine kinase/CheY-like chemotaxis protein